MQVQNPASFWKRVAATILDGIFISIIGTIIVKTFNLNPVSSNLTENLLRFFYILLVPLFWFGYTIGKKALKIRMLRLNGENPTFLNMFLRSIGSFVYVLPTIVGFYGTFGANANDYANTLKNIVASGTFPVSLSVGFLLTLGLFTVSVLMVAIRQDRRSIHDFIGGTYVKEES